jgi:hypothetical protein
MQIDTAASGWRVSGPSGLVALQREGWILAGVVDGAGSWGTGVEAADWSLERLTERWSQGPIDPVRVAADVRDVRRSLPRELREPDGDSAYSVSVVLASGTVCHVVAAGCYGVVLVERGVPRDLFRPRTWADVQVEDGSLGREAARSHPLRHVMVGPLIADRKDSAPATSGPFALRPGAAIVVAEYRNLEVLDVSALSQPAPARAVQALLERPRLPVVVIQA